MYGIGGWNFQRKMLKPKNNPGLIIQRRLVILTEETAWNFEGEKLHFIDFYSTNLEN